MKTKPFYVSIARNKDYYTIFETSLRYSSNETKKCLVTLQFPLRSELESPKKRHGPFSSDISIRPSSHQHLDYIVDISTLQQKFPYKMRIQIPLIWITEYTQSCYNVAILNIFCKYDAEYLFHDSEPDCYYISSQPLSSCNLTCIFLTFTPRNFIWLSSRVY
jgi:hypothetical protein